MSKLYVFAIGGTGARVLKSLTFLLASGVDCNADEIVPIIIDPDAANGDVNKTTKILHSYQNIRSKLSFDNHTKNKFFRTLIGSLNQNFRIEIQNSDQEFRSFIGYNSMDRNNQALTSLLFSQQNLEADMEVGFKGNPNMGSVVLNQFQNSKDFNDFAANFGQNDRIFIVSSIFGGTGASGFPLLLKNLREASPSIPNSALLKAAPIGAISVLPYFGVENKEKATVDKATFISKTKAALRYYQHGVNNSLNTMYYIGEEPKNNYEHNEGSTGQQNNAHFIELASALAIVDFANESNYTSAVIKEFGIANNSQDITFSDLHNQTKYQIFKPLTQYYFKYLYLDQKLRKNFDAKYAATIGIDSSFLNTPFYKDLTAFNERFWEWLDEMATNKRGFKPFTLKKKTEDILSSVEGIGIKDGGFMRPKNYERFIAKLNKSLEEDNPSKEKESRFMENFYLATDKLVKEK